MIEYKQDIRFKIVHPFKDKHITIMFVDETDMDDWIPYLNKFEDYLIQVKLKELKKKKQ